MFIPMFLAFNAVGWMMLAMKTVAVLTIKAFLVSKLAFIVASSVVVKKLMDTATEKYKTELNSGCIRARSWFLTEWYLFNTG